MCAKWQPSAEITVLKRRAQYFADVRHFFWQRGVWEVDTPILSQAASTSPYIDSFVTDYIPLGGNKRQARYLHTSPEFAMKRLLAAGSGAIFQIAKVFRNGESGRYHAPEFTMLEWYRPGWTLMQLMEEVQALVEHVFHQPLFEYQCYQHLFQYWLDLDVMTCSDAEIQQCAHCQIAGLPDDFQTDRDGYLDLLMTHCIEPKLAQKAIFVYDFPASQAQLARIEKNDTGYDVAKRFELYVNGIEIANGYDELTDAEECRRRFSKENQQRMTQSKPEMPVDEALLAAMENGLPECSGVALGLDRMIMVAEKQSQLTAVTSFAFEQA